MKFVHHHPPVYSARVASIHPSIHPFTQYVVYYVYYTLPVGVHGGKIKPRPAIRSRVYSRINVSFLLYIPPRDVCVCVFSRVKLDHHDDRLATPPNRNIIIIILCILLACLLLLAG
jgi:hypothetical protein